MTEQQKDEALASIRLRIDAAEQRGLKATARSWREYYVNVANRAAGEMVLSNKRRWA